jgi:hypothetical protein
VIGCLAGDILLSGQVTGVCERGRSALIDADSTDTSVDFLKNNTQLAMA